LTPRLPASGRTPEWGQSFLGEVTIWALTVATIMYAVTLPLDYLAPALIWGVFAQVFEAT
jgi:hypothetical protein